jgi:hypothetical protein
MTETMSSMGGSVPSGADMGIVMQLAELMSNPYLPEGQRMVAQALIQQQMGAMFAPQQPGFRMLSAEEAQGMGLPPGSYQMGPDNRIVPVGGGETVINNNLPGAAEIGSIPQGFEVFTNPDTGQREMRRIPGGPEDQSDQQAAAADRQGTTASVVLTAIQGVRNALEKNGPLDIIPEAGVVGNWLAERGWNQEAVDVKNQLDTIKASVAFDTLQAMRAASPTGGALGAVSDREMALLQAALGTLSQDSSPALLRQSLDQIEAIMKKFDAYPNQPGAGVTMSDDELLQMYGGQ